MNINEINSSNINPQKDRASTPSYSMSSIFVGLQGEMDQLVENPSEFIQQPSAEYIQGTLNLLSNFMQIASVPTADKLAFEQLQSDFSTLLNYVSSKSLPPTALVDQIVNLNQALSSSTEQIPLTGVQLTNAIHATLNNLLTQTKSEGFPSNPSELNVFIGTICGLENLSCFQGPTNSDGTIPVTNTYLNNINDSAIPLLNFAFSSDPSDKQHAEELIQSMQSSILSLLKENWN